MKFISHTAKMDLVSWKGNIMETTQETYGHGKFVNTASFLETCRVQCTFPTCFLPCFRWHMSRNLQFFVVSDIDTARLYKILDTRIPLTFHTGSLGDMASGGNQYFHQLLLTSFGIPVQFCNQGISITHYCNWKTHKKDIYTLCLVHYNKYTLYIALK